MIKSMLKKIKEFFKPLPSTEELVKKIIGNATHESLKIGMDFTIAKCIEVVKMSSDIQDAVENLEKIKKIIEDTVK